MRVSLPTPTPVAVQFGSPLPAGSHALSSLAKTCHTLLLGAGAVRVRSGLSPRGHSEKHMLSIAADHRCSPEDPFQTDNLRKSEFTLQMQLQDKSPVLPT